MKTLTEGTLTAEDVMPRILDASQEPQGSQYLQIRLGDGVADDVEVDKIFNALLPSAMRLASDLHGSGCIQKLLGRVAQEQATAMAAKLQGEIFTLSNHKWGCRVVQKAMEVIPDTLQVQLAAELKDRVRECAENKHGNHVVQVCVKWMLPSRVTFVLDAMLRNVEEMSQHKYGCRVLQRLLERCSPQALAPLLDRIMANVARLAKVRYANYVVQSVLERGRREDKRRTIQIIRDSFLEYAKDKASSNVVEKCFEVAAVGPDAEFLKDERVALYRAVLGDPADAQSSPLQQLMLDAFGSKTVQCIIKHSRGDDRDALQERVSAAEQQLTESPTGRHVLAAMEKAMGRTPEDPKDAEASPDAPSRGSALHSQGLCKPCAWFWKPGSCQKGQDCYHCHLCGEGELKVRKKARRRGGDRPEGGDGPPESQQQPALA